MAGRDAGSTEPEQPPTTSKVSLSSLPLVAASAIAAPAATLITDPAC
jgi:hypothetical protein